MRTSLFQSKYRAAALVLLCISGILNPYISSCGAHIPPEEDYAKMTVEAYGLPGGRQHTITLTQSQHSRLLSFLDTIGKRLDAASTQEDAKNLFHEAIDVLNTYGLLPNSLSISQMDKLVNRWYDHYKIAVHREHPFIKKWLAHPQVSNLPKVYNRFCFVHATATKIPGYSPDPVIIPLGVLVALGIYPALIASIFGNDGLANRLAELGLSLWISNPLRAFNYVIFKGYTIEFKSLGLNGLVSKTLSGSGAFIGFSGLMLTSSSDTTSFLGYTYFIYGTV